MIDKSQLRQMIKDILTPIGLYNPSAADLLMGTAAQESQLGTYWSQLGGPALGIFQMEPATDADIWDNYLVYHPDLAVQINARQIGHEMDLRYNLAYQIVMCRVHYLRQPEALPPPGFVSGLAKYWKRYYNTPLGRGTEAEFIANYQKYVVK